MSEKQDAERRMSVAWRENIEVIAGQYSPRDTRESWLARAARRAGITYRQAKGLYYGETTDPKVSVADRVRSAAGKARSEALALAGEYEAIAGRINALRHTDEDFHCNEIAALIATARALRDLAGTGDS
jgi:hypothetical protein